MFAIFATPGYRWMRLHVGTYCEFMQSMDLVHMGKSSKHQICSDNVQRVYYNSSPTHNRQSWIINGIYPQPIEIHRIWYMGWCNGMNTDILLWAKYGKQVYCSGSNKLEKHKLSNLNLFCFFKNTTEPIRPNCELHYSLNKHRSTAFSSW